jgi:hypothetical protein
MTTEYKCQIFNILPHISAEMGIIHFSLEKINGDLNGIIDATTKLHVTAFRVSAAFNEIVCL